MNLDQALLRLRKAETPEAYRAVLDEIDATIAKVTQENAELAASRKARLLELQPPDIIKLQARVSEGAIFIEQLTEIRAAAAEKLPSVERKAKLAELGKRAQKERMQRDKSAAWLEQRYQALQQEIASNLEDITKNNRALGAVQGEAMALNITDAERESFGLRDLRGAEAVVREQHSIPYHAWMPTEVTVLIAYPSGPASGKGFVGTKMQLQMPMPRQPMIEAPAPSRNEIPKGTGIVGYMLPRFGNR